MVYVGGEVGPLPSLQSRPRRELRRASDARWGPPENRKKKVNFRESLDVMCLCVFSSQFFWDGISH